MPGPIGNRLPPPVPPTSTFGGANDIGSVNAAGPGGVGNAGAVAQDGIALPQQAKSGARASDVAKELDVLFSKAASSTVASLDAAALEKAIAGVKLPKAARKALQAEIAGLVKEARDSMKALDQFDGRSIFKAIRAAKSGARTDEEVAKKWSVSMVGKAVERALSAQSALADKLSDLINGTGAGAEFRAKLDKLKDAAAGGILAALDEAKFQCDRRVCELESIEGEIMEAVEQELDPPAEGGKKNDVKQIAKASLGKSITSLMGDKAYAMHDKASSLLAMQEKIAPVIGKIRDLGAGDTKVPQAKLNNLAAEVNELRSALAEIAAKGVVEVERDGEKTQLLVDRSFVAEAAKMLDEAAGRLKDISATMRKDALTSMMQKGFGLHSYSVFDAKFTAIVKPHAPLACQFAKVRDAFDAACRAYIKSPSKGNEKAMHTAAKKVSEWLDKHDEDLLLELPKLYSAHKKNIQLAMKKNSSGVETPVNPLEEELVKAMGDEMTNVVLGKTDKDFMKFLDCRMQELHAAADMLVAESKKFTAADKTSIVVTGAVRNVLDGNLSMTTLVEARVNGLADVDVDPEVDDRNAVSSRELGKGGLNTVTLVKYGDGTERVFKPEVAGRIGVTRMPLLADMPMSVQLTTLNLATMRTARAFGLEDTVVKTTAGVHDGQYGLFMEKAKGVSAANFADSKNVPSRANSDEYTLKDINELKKTNPGEARRITGELMRQTTRLEWLDILSGQGDRHRENFFVHVGKDGNVSVKGIDNDTGFSTTRTGLTTYSMKGPEAFNKFKSCVLELCIDLYGSIDTRSVTKLSDVLLSDPSIKVTRKERPERKADDLFDTREDDEDDDVQSFDIDTSKIENPLLTQILFRTLGIQTVHVPTCIDQETYDKLMAMDGDTKARADYLEGLKKDLGPGDAYENAVSRLDDAIRHAKKLHQDGKVYTKDQWKEEAVQDQFDSAPTTFSSPLSGQTTQAQQRAVDRKMRKAVAMSSSMYARIAS